MARVLRNRAVPLLDPVTLVAASPGATTAATKTLDKNDGIEVAKTMATIADATGEKDQKALQSSSSTRLNEQGTQSGKEGEEITKTAEDFAIDQELKDLKAAYKTALNGKKKRKPRKVKVVKGSCHGLEASFVASDGQQGTSTATAIDITPSAGKMPCAERNEDTAVQNAVKEAQCPPVIDICSSILVPSQGQGLPAEDDNVKLTQVLSTGAPPSAPKSLEVSAKQEMVMTPTDCFSEAIELDTDEKEDSFLEQILTRSPAKVSRVVDDGLAPESTTSDMTEIHSKKPSKRSASRLSGKNVSIALEVHDDSFIKDITTRSPAKTVLTKKSGSSGIAPNQTSVQKSRPAKPSNHQSSTPTTAAKKSLVKRPTSLLPPRSPVKSSKPLTVPSFKLSSEAITRQLKEKREARLASRTPCTSKTTKPTRPASTFGRPPTITSSKLGKSSAPRQEERHQTSGRLPLVERKNETITERERHEKEARARKARQEAAEKGREASRRWAEQRKSQLALEKAVK